MTTLFLFLTISKILLKAIMLWCNLEPGHKTTVTTLDYIMGCNMQGRVVSERLEMLPEAAKHLRWYNCLHILSTGLLLNQ